MLRFLVKTANDKMELNRKRTDGFLQVLESKFLCNKDCDNEDEEMMDNCPEGNFENYESAELIADGNADSGEAGLDNHSGFPRDTPCSISVSKMMISGEPVDNLFVWVTQRVL